MEAAVDRAMIPNSVGGTPISSVQDEILSSPPTRSEPVTTSTDRGPYLGAGSYTLVAYCAGRGHVAVMLSVGKATTRRTVACQMLPQSIRLRLRARHGGETTVQFAPRERETIAVAYQLFAGRS
jgi:hypothetical protein